MDDDAIEYTGDWAVSEQMERQEEIQRKIEAFEKIDEDVKNGIKPF